MIIIGLDSFNAKEWNVDYTVKVKGVEFQPTNEPIFGWDSSPVW